MTRIGRADEAGSMLPMFGGLILIAFLMIALGAELALLGGTYRRTADVADAAAEAGAASVSASAVYESKLELDAFRAEAESLSLARDLSDPGALVTVVGTSENICVTVVNRHRPTTLAFLGVDGIDVTVTSCAEPRTG